MILRTDDILAHHAAKLYHMNPNTPSHEEVTRRAEEIWREKGCPSDRDEEIWLEAERQLSARSATPSPSGGAQDRGNGNSQPVTTGGSSSTPADPEPAQSGGTEQKTPPPSPIQAEAESTQLKK